MTTSISHAPLLPGIPVAGLPAGGLALLQPARGPRGARRLARALLEEAAVLGGGQVLTLPGGDLLLMPTISWKGDYGLMVGIILRMVLQFAKSTIFYVNKQSSR